MVAQAEFTTHSDPTPKLPLDNASNAATRFEVVTEVDVIDHRLDTHPLATFKKNGHLDLPRSSVRDAISPLIKSPQNDYSIPIYERPASPEQTSFQKRPLAALESVVRKIDPLIKDNEIHASLGGHFPRPFGRDGDITAMGKFSTFTDFPLPGDTEERARIAAASLGMHRYIATEDYPLAGKEAGKKAHEVGTEDQGYPKQFYKNEREFGENYDSLESTDWALLAAADVVRHYPQLKEATVDSVGHMTAWAIRNVEEFGGPAYVGANYDPRRFYPGLTDQRWRDGYRTTVNSDGSIPTHPIYPVFEAALRWSSLMNAADVLQGENPELDELSAKAMGTADYLKEWFSEQFLYEDAKGVYLADALDGYWKQITPVTVDGLLALLPTHNGQPIIDDPELRRDIIRRAQRELFDSRGGLYTVSKTSFVHPDSDYQNSNSIWPHTVGMSVKLLEDEAKRVEEIDLTLAGEYRDYALNNALAVAGGLLYWGSPVETFQISDSGEMQYFNNGSTETCKVQAWTGAWGEYAFRYLQSRGITEIPVPIKTEAMAAD